MSAHGAYSLSDLQSTPAQQGHFSLSDLADAPSPDTYKPGALHAILSDIEGGLRGLASKGSLATAATLGLYAPIQAYTTLKQAAQQVPLEDAARKQQGRSLPYRIAAPVAENLAGVNVLGMEQAAAHGDVAGVLGHTVVPTALAASPLAIEGVGRVANRVIPSTTRAGAGFNMLEHAYQAHPVPVDPVKAEISNIANEAATNKMNVNPMTGEGLPEPIRAYLRDDTLANAMHSRPDLLESMRAEGKYGGDPGTFGNARIRLKSTNKLINAMRPSPEQDMLKRFAGALSDAIDTGVSQPSSVAPEGFAKDYAAMQNEYRRGMKTIRTADAIGPYIGGGLGYEIGRRLGDPIGGTVAGSALGYAGRPVIGGLVRSVIERDAGAPSLSSVPRPVPASPAEYTRTILNAKEGNISPGYADTLIKRAGGSTKVSPIDRSNVTPTVNAPPAPSEPATPVNGTSTPLAPPPPPVRSAPISADEPPLPPNTVRVNVKGEDRMVKLSDDQMQKWNEAQARFQSSQDWARRSFANDPQEMQARLKGIGMRYAAEKRAITGQLTGRENAVIRARQATNYVGKPISLRGQNATVLGTAFGRIKVRLADGTTTTALPEDIDDPLPPPPQ